MLSHTYKETINLGAGVLSKVVERNVFESRIILAHVLGVSVESLISRPMEKVKAEDFNRFMDLISRRTKYEPVAYLIGKKEFYELEFLVNANVLIPRPDSETLVDWVLNHYDYDVNIRILELGVGSGCLLLTILKHMKNASGVAVDISSAAITVAQENYENLGLTNQIEWYDCGWGALQKSEKGFDLIISNPPYITKNELVELQPDVREYEPEFALVGGDDGLDAYREIAPIIYANLTKDGKVVLEIGKGQETEVADIMKDHGLQLILELRDLSNNIRTLVFSLSSS